MQKFFYDPMDNSEFVMNIIPNAVKRQELLDSIDFGLEYIPGGLVHNHRTGETLQFSDFVSEPEPLSLQEEVNAFAELLRAEMSSMIGQRNWFGSSTPPAPPPPQNPVFNVKFPYSWDLPDHFVITRKAKACECGNAKCNLPGHSTWCPMFEG